VFSVVSGLFGSAHTFVNSLLGGLVLPLYPIALTLHYYSMKARAEFRPPPPMPVPIVAAGYCPSCGQAFEAGQRFCARCGYDLGSRVQPSQ
jgi:hypothetical protein